MPTLSVVIITLNEERHIEDVLKAAQPLADEIVFVDSGSTDRTIEIAKTFGVSLYHQDWLGYGKQKNFAIGLAKCEWILSLDGDEIMTPELVAEIKSTLERSDLSQYDGFRIPRILYVGGRAIRHGGFYPDAHLRLFRRGKGKFNDRLVHESVVVEGNIGRLKHPLKNMAYDLPDEFAATLDKYARLSAEHALQNGYHSWRLSSLNEHLHPCWTFFYRYVLRGGFLDGALGLKLQLMYSDYVRKKIKYLKDAVRTA